MNTVHHPATPHTPQPLTLSLNHKRHQLIAQRTKMQKSIVWQKDFLSSLGNGGNPSKQPCQPLSNGHIFS